MSNLAPSSGAGKTLSANELFGDVVARRVMAEGPSAAVSFLRSLDPTGWHNLVRFDPTEQRPGPIGLTIPPGRWDLAEAFVTEWAGRENLYFSVNEPKPNAPGKKLQKGDIAAIRAIPADIDLPGANDAEAVRALQARVSAACANLPTPTFRVDSGGGLQLHWRLANKLPATPENLEWAENEARAIARELGGDGVGNIDRIMRLPGVLNIPTPGKRAKGRVERPAVLKQGEGPTHTPEALRTALPPIPQDTGDRLDKNDRIAAVQADFAAAWSEIASFGAFEDLPSDLRQRFELARQRSAPLTRLWDGEPPQSGDVSGSGYRAALARLLRLADGFDAYDFVSLAQVWDFAVQPHHDRNDKLTPRALARDWVRVAEATPSPSELAEQWFEPVNDNDPLFPEDATPPHGSTYPVLSIGDLFTRPDPVFMLDRHIPESSLGFLYGDPGTGKSFIALDWALHFAFGRPSWQGDAIRIPNGASVIYIAAEGASGFKTRVRAWMKAHDIPQTQQGRFGLIFQNVNFMRSEDVDRLAATLRASAPDGVCLLVVDTVSRAMPGADENLQKEMTLFVEACQSFQREFGAAVLGVHHANKVGDMRGSGVLKGAGDFVFKLERKSGAAIGALRCEKQKDAPDGWSERYRFDVVHVDEAQTSLVPFRCETVATAGLTPQVSENILDAIEQAWVSGEPWSANYRASKRYAANIMVRDFGFEPDAAKALLSNWLGMGLIEEAEFSAKDHKMGLRVVRDPANEADAEDNMSGPNGDGVFD